MGNDVAGAGWMGAMGNDVAGLSSVKVDSGFLHLDVRGRYC